MHNSSGLIHGDTHEAGPGHVEVELECPVNGRWAVKKQFTQLGSFLKVVDPENKLAVSGSFSLAAFIWPTMPQRGTRQTILGRWDTLRNTGYALGINPAGHLEFWVGNGTEVDYVTAELPLLAKVWYLVGISYDRDTGRAELYQEGVLNRYNSLVGKVVPYDFASHVVQHFRFRPDNKPGVPFLIAGARDEHALRGRFRRRPLCRENRPARHLRPRADARRIRRFPARRNAAAGWAARLLGHLRGLQRERHRS